MPKIIQANDPMTTFLWDWWKFEIRPELTRLPSEFVVQQANTYEMISRVMQRIAMKEN